MKRFLPGVLMPLLCLPLLLSGCGGSGDSSSPTDGGKTADGGGKKLSIVIIPKGTTHVFWKTVEAGARQAGTELGVDVQWKGPVSENDRDEQIKIVEQFASEGVSGIVLAPLDDTALVRPVKGAAAK